MEHTFVRQGFAPAGALGSPGFVSPEVVHDAPHEPSMDIFSLGVVLFVMLVGRKPFSFQAGTACMPAMCAFVMLGPLCRRQIVPRACSTAYASISVQQFL
jgi:serine/threonine protein kinase